MVYPVFQPFLGPEELAACKEALDCKYLGMGSFVGQFEQLLSEQLQLDPHLNLVTVSTGHAALHLALLSLGIGPGDEVITPSFNNVADFQAIDATGAKSVFVDVEDDSLCIDCSQIISMINPKTKAIITMDYGARIADHSKVVKIAREYGLFVIHDAAHSFGSVYEGHPIGHQCDVTMFSFDPIKNITCIDGGALVFSNSLMLEPLREMRMIGMAQNVETSYSNKRDWGYDVHRLGFRYHLANLHASVGISQLKKFDVIRSKRRKLYEIYHDRLSSLPFCRTQGPLSSDVVPFIMCLRVKSSVRSGLKEYLSTQGIETGIHWRPGHTFTRYKLHTAANLSVTSTIANEILSLPFYPDLNACDVHFICDRIAFYLNQFL